MKKNRHKKQHVRPHKKNERKYENMRNGMTRWDNSVFRERATPKKAYIEENASDVGP